MWLMNGQVFEMMEYIDTYLKPSPHTSFEMLHLCKNNTYKPASKEVFWFWVCEISIGAKLGGSGGSGAPAVFLVS